MARSTVTPVQRHGRVLKREAQDAHNRDGRGPKKYVDLADGYAALAAPAQPGEPLTNRQQACSAIALRVGDAQRRVPELRGGMVELDPAALYAELSARHVKAQGLLGQQQTSPGGATPDVVEAERALKEAMDQAELIEQQDAEPKANQKRSTRQRGNRPGAQPGSEDEIPLNPRFESDPELANSEAVRQKELEQEGVAPGADGTESAEPEQSSGQTPGKPPTIDAGTARRGGDGEVFTITRMSSPAGSTSPPPAASALTPLPPPRHRGAAGLSPHTRAAATRRVNARAGSRPGKTGSGKADRYATSSN